MKKFLILFLIFIISSTSAHSKQNSDDVNTKNKIEYLNLQWWQNFNDDILIEHLKNLYLNNYDLKNAELKIKESEKIVKLEFANELPEINFNGFISRDFRSSEQRFGSMSIPSYAQNNFQLPLTASYEIDIWGKNRLKTKSAQQKLEIVKQAQRATYISLTSDFASDYYNLIKVDELLNIQEELIKIQTQITEKIKDKYEIGMCSISEVLSEEKILTSLKEEKNNLEDKKETLVNILRSYLSLRSGDILRTSFSDIKLIENIPEEFDSNIIENRPDFLQAESDIKRLGYDVRVARKELLPSFIIFGQIGLNAYRFSDLFKNFTQLASAGIVPEFDIFSGGRKIAFLKLKKYQYDEALNNYQKTIVEDIKEVNTALAEFKTSKKNFIESEQRVKIQDKIFILATDKTQIGSASNLDLLYSKEADLIVKKDKVSNTINYLVSAISLYKASGGKNLSEVNEDI